MQSDDELLLEGLRKYSQFAERMEAAKQRISTDSLTGLASRTKGEAYLKYHLGAGRRLTVVLVNLDRFKQVNNQWGPYYGDEVLKSVATTLASYSQRFDTICRWDGDKFLLISKFEKKRLTKLIETLRGRVSRSYKIALDKIPVQVEISASLSATTARSGETIDSLLTRAESDIERDRLGTDPAVARKNRSL